MDIAKLIDHNKLLTLLGHLGMLAILCLAWTLWLERSTTYDSSLYSYMIITREAVYTPHDRLINYLWQWMPILSLKLGVSLTTFMKGMSLAPIMMLYGVYCIITYGLKNALAGVYMILCLVIFTRYKFYSAIPEIFLCTSFVAMMAAWLTTKNNRQIIPNDWKTVLIGVAIISLCYLGHPLIFFPLGVVIVFDYLLKGEWKSLPHFVWLAVVGLLFGIKYWMGRGTSHEGGVISGFFQSISDDHLLEKTMDLYTLDIFWRYVETQWALPLVVCFALMIYLCIQKKYLAILFLLSANAVWVFFVIHLCAYLDKPYLFMIEGYFGLMALMLLLPLLYVELPQNWMKQMRVGVLGLLLVFGVHRIYSVRSFFENRISDIHSKIEQGAEAGVRNMIYDSGTKHWDKYWFLWSVPFESVMHSSLMEEGKTSVVIIDTYPAKRYFEEPFEIMIGTDKDTLSKMTNPYFNFNADPFMHMQ